MTAVTHTHLLTGPDEDFGPRAGGIVTLHSFQNSDRTNDIAAAIRGAQYQDRPDIFGSYNRIIATNGILQTVPDDHASGGINPSSAKFNPEPWLFDFLDRDEIFNPNYFTLNLCAMGDCDWYDANGWPPSIIDGFALSIIDEELRIGGPVVVTNHMDFQDNRHDAGAKCIALVMARYHEIKAGSVPAVEDEMYEWVAGMKPALFRATILKGVPMREAPVSTSGYFRLGDTGRTITFIGEVADMGGGDIPYIVYALGAGGLRVTRKDNVEGAITPLGVATTTEVVKEVIKEVPTGITQDQLTAATTAATTAERERLALAEANRIRNS